MASLRDVIAQTLSPDAGVRGTAEAQLSEGLKNPQHPLEVLHLIASSNAADAAVRQAAAVHFKNIVKHGWDESKDEEQKKGIVIPSEARNTIKKHLVELMCTVPPQIQAQISETISLIAEVDFPEKWQDLLPALVHKLKSPDVAVINGVLTTANAIFKRFRYVQRCDQLYGVIIKSLNHFQEPLLTMFVQTGQYVEAYRNDKAQLVPRLEALRLMCRIFYSLNYQDLPEFFEDHMKDWMGEFAKYLQYSNPLLQDPDEETDPSPVEKLQAAIMQNLKLYSDKDEEEFIPYLPNFTSLVWNLLNNLTAYPKHDVLVVTSLSFLSSLIRKQMHSDLFKEEATLRQLVSRIIVPNMMVREADEEKFEEDPQEFIQTEIEGSDSESRRTCSRDLLKSMCRHFMEQTTAICSEHVNSMLAEFAADNSKWAAKDTAIHLMLGIAVKLESHQGVSEINENVNLMDFFTSQIFPELQDGNHANRPMVKATALKFVCTFRKQFTREQLVSLIPLMIAHLESSSVVVHTLAAYAIERIMMTLEAGAGGKKTYKVTRTDLQIHLEALFTGLFRIVDNTELNENEHAMKCIMRTLARAGEDVIPVTGIVFNKLAAALERVCKNPRNPSYNHYLFESIAALVRNVCSKDPSQTNQLETLLFPPFQAVLQLDVLEFTPYVFQVLAQLLEYRPEESGLGDAYQSLFPPLLTAALWERRGNVPGLTRLVTAYLKKAANNLVAAGHLISLLGIFQSLNATKSTETSAFELLSAITTYVSLDALTQYMKTILTLICTKLTSGKSIKYGALASRYFALFVGLHGSQTFFDCLNQVSPGVALTLLVKIWIPKLQEAATTRVEAKKQVIGLTRLLCETPALLNDDNGKQIWTQTFRGAIVILTSQTLSRNVDKDDEGVESAIGYDATFSQLSLASKNELDPFESIADPLATFASNILTLSQSQPGVLAPLIQQSVSSDPKLSSGLQSLIHTTGINFV